MLRDWDFVTICSGTQRLPKLIGLLESLPLVLTGKLHCRVFTQCIHVTICKYATICKYVTIRSGKTLNGSKAKKLGLVDSVADPFALEHAAMLVSMVWGLGFRV